MSSSLMASASLAAGGDVGGHAPFDAARRRGADDVEVGDDAPCQGLRAFDVRDRDTP
jgi:hypothetical protein